MIVCDYCKKEVVDVNGTQCPKCIEMQKKPNVEDRIKPSNKVYLEPVLYNKLQKMVKDIEEEKNGSKKVLGKFMNLLKTSFIDKKTGKEINDPSPMVIIPKHSTLDRIQKILNHNINVYSEQNGMETEESMQDFTVNDIYSDQFEQSIYQYVDNIEIMQPDEIIDEIEEETPEEKPSTEEPTTEA